MTAKFTQAGVCSASLLLPFRPIQVLDAFSDPEWLTAWWGPEGFLNTTEVFEFKTGGRWVYVTDAEDGAQSTVENKFVEVSPERIVIRSGSVPRSTVTANLKDVDGQTEIHWRQVFEDPRAASDQAALASQVDQNLDRLKAVLETAAPD